MSYAKSIAPGSTSSLTLSGSDRLASAYTNQKQDSSFGALLSGNTNTAQSKKPFAQYFLPAL